MKRHKFNLSHYKLGSADMGKLYPISCYEVLPGDTVQQGTSLFLRFAPMLAPVMHPVRVGIYTFYVPFRLLWDDFEDFITGGPDGLDTSVPPTITCTASGGVPTKSVWDYLGVPTGYTGAFSAFPHRAYAKIFNEYFCDQDLVTRWPAGDTTTGGNTDYPSASNPVAVAWEKDYFTTARPWPQKGAEVTVPVEGLQTAQGTVSISGSTTAPTFTGISDHNSSFNLGGLILKANGDGGSTTTQVSDIQFYNTSSFVDTSPSDAGLFSNSLNGTDTAYVMWRSPSLKATFTGTGDASTGNVRLDALREAFALQRFQEHRAMYGSRYTEYLRYLGVRSSDARLQRPEYLGGGKSTVQFSEVMQSAADGDNPVGTLRGHGVGVVRTKNFRRFIEEHGLIMTLMSVRPIAIYQNGLPKMYSRTVKEDYWQKELEHIGQQEVMTKELFANVSDPDTVFGYQNRYDEYRSVPSTVCGEMRSTLNYWHLARDFANAPVLNDSFVAGAPTKRVFAEQTQNEIYFMAQHNIVARRILSKQGNPIL